MATILGNTTPYCTNANSQLYVDVRQIADTLLDDGNRATTAQLAASPVWTEMLLSASGEIEMSAVRGARYTPADLATLAASSTASAATLRKMTAWLAFTNAWMRRRPSDEIPQAGVWAYGLLDKLGIGEKIFSIEENVQADLPDCGFMSEGDFAALGVISDVACRYYGKRGKYYRPLGSGSCGCGPGGD